MSHRGGTCSYIDHYLSHAAYLGGLCVRLHNSIHVNTCCGTIYTIHIRAYSEVELGWNDVHWSIQSTTLLHALLLYSTKFLDVKYKKGLHSDGTFSLCLLPPDNAIPIKSWFSDAQDTALLELLPMLDALRFTNDVRSVLSRNLHLHSLWWCVWCNYGEFCFICRMFLYHTIVCIRCKKVNFLVLPCNYFIHLHSVWLTPSEYSGLEIACCSIAKHQSECHDTRVMVSLQSAWLVYKCVFCNVVTSNLQSHTHTNWCHEVKSYVAGCGST